MHKNKNKIMIYNFAAQKTPLKNLSTFFYTFLPSQYSIFINIKFFITAQIMLLIKFCSLKK